MKKPFEFIIKNKSYFPRDELFQFEVLYIEKQVEDHDNLDRLLSLLN
jgi:hypothetical protein